MCCFSKPVRFVGGTRIFARRVDPSHQLLVYAMDVEFDEPLAMVLPLPVPAGVGEHDVRFLDLSNDPDFFSQLANAFPAMWQSASRGMPVAASAPAKTLVVHEVGMYVASFVPSVADFGRLDPRFRLPRGVIEGLGVASDHGFAVFQLSPKTKGLLFKKAERQTIHPMAFVFPTREAEGLFFPTLHVHDGTVPERASFDHSLYCQAEDLLGATLPWTRSQGPLGQFVRSPSAGTLLAADRHGFQQALHGSLPNRDVFLAPPTGLTEAMLSLRGECFEASLSLAQAYTFEPSDERFRRWQETARTRMPSLSAGLAEGLAALERDRREAFGLVPLSPALEPCFLNGDLLFHGTSWIDGSPNVGSGPMRITFREFTDRVEPQPITLGFAKAPDASTLASVRASLRSLLDRAVAA
ncbi:MAG: hypothetical protein U0230_17585 [Polyangiales bacterium]